MFNEIKNFLLILIPYTKNSKKPGISFHKKLTFTDYTHNSGRNLSCHELH